MMVSIHDDGCADVGAPIEVDKSEREMLRYELPLGWHIATGDCE